MDHTVELEELPIRIAGQPVGYVNGSASLAWDEGYGFVVLGIDLDTEDGGILTLNERSDDPEIVKAFRDISAEIYRNEAIAEEFADALAEYRRAA